MALRNHTLALPEEVWQDTFEIYRKRSSQICYPKRRNGVLTGLFDCSFSTNHLREDVVRAGYFFTISVGEWKNTMLSSKAARTRPAAAARARSVKKTNDRRLFFRFIAGALNFRCFRGGL